MESTGIRHIIFSIDYELFGNGSGDVIRHMIEPARQLAGIGKRWKIPFTFFIEMEEYFAFRKFRVPLTNALQYDPAALVEQQVAELVKEGHDVQLHLHPQWYGAEYRNNVWILNRRVSTVDELFARQEDATDYIADRKNALEQLARAADPTFTVSAFRAGAFCAQPGERLLRALAANEIRFDTSLVKGMFRAQYPELNYRIAPRNLWYWRVSCDVCSEDAAGDILEVPIYSRMGRRCSQLTGRRLKAKFSRNVPQNKQRELVRELGIMRSPLSLIRLLFEPVPIKLDLHNLSGAALMDLIKDGEQSDRVGQVPVYVAIGHTKEHSSDHDIDRFVQLVQQTCGLRVCTFSQLRSCIQ
jgi:hypothetical protein